MKKKCILCKDDNLEIFFSLEKFPLFFGAVDKNYIDQVPRYDLDMSYCKKCGHVQQTNLIDEEIMNSVYTAEYYNCPSPSCSDIGEREILKFYDFFKRSKLNKGVLMEVACFDGFLLNLLNKDGWDIYGCDPATQTDIALDKFGKNKIKKEFLSKNTFQNKKFDVIVFRNLLEHIYDINGFIELISSILTENGSIFIDLPNVNTTEDYGGYGLFFHQHISYFSIDTMKYFLDKNNFHVVNYFEGSPNLFIHAKKNKDKSEIKNFTKFNPNKLISRNKDISERIIFFLKSEKNISFFGASALATTILCKIDDDVKLNVKKIYDNEKIKHDKILQGTDITISNPNTITNSDDTKFLITSFFFDNEIYEQLINQGINQNKIIKINSLLK